MSSRPTSSPVVPGVAITSHRPNPSSPWFFDWIFKKPAYRRWNEINTPARLLRLVGGPGCGKTSFATLAVKKLQQQDNDTGHAAKKPRTVLSVFLKPSDINSAQAAVEQEQRHVPFSVQFLAEIEKQLDAALNLDSFLTPPASPEDQTAEGVLSSIRFKLHRFSDVYLVVDDIDCLSVLPKEYFQVEGHLEALRSHGVRVLVTSRTTFQFSNLLTKCDVHLEGDDDDDDHDDDDEEEEEEENNDPKHSHDEENGEGLITWWSCDRDDHEKFNLPFIICSNCKAAGFGCGNPSHPPAVFSGAPRPVTLDISNAPPTYMEAFIIHQLQLEHGHFSYSPLNPCPWDPKGEAAPKHIYPPLSPLGNRLLSVNLDQPSSEVATLLGRIVKLANGNLTAALCRLEAVHQAESLDDAVKIKDRLPANVVDMFNELVRRHIQDRLTETSPPELRARAALALHAIRITGKNLNHGVLLKFKELREHLIEEDEECFHGFEDILDGKYGQDELLGAAGGLLVMDDSNDDRIILFFHQDFEKYVEERYNEFLAGTDCDKVQTTDITVR